jgi:transcriptional regulator with XRE-family HTH domain
VEDLEGLCARFKELRGKQRSQSALARRTGVDRTRISKIENGGMPSVPDCEKYDRFFGLSGELVSRRARVVAAQGEIRETGSELVVGQGRVEVRGKTGCEVSPVDRRQFFASAALATSLSEQIASADPTPPTLREIAADVDRIAATYTRTPATALVPGVEKGWLDAERLLDTRLSPKARTRLTLHAGQYSFYLAMLAGDLGHGAAADAYLDLAGQHATESGDLLLGGSVAALDSSHAYFRGDHTRAADVAGEARVGAHPYVRAMLAICEARASALCGRPDAARAALADMWEHVWEGPILPGEVMVDEEQAIGQTAVILGFLRDGEAAETYARRAIKMFAARGVERTAELGKNHNALCWALLRRRDPDPEQAADAARRALQVIDGQPVSWVVSRTGQISREMEVRWPELPAVRDLGEMVRETRKALPAARSV